jgi:hypothetical protein
MMRMMLYEAAQTLLGSLDKMLLAQGLGDEDRQAPRNKEGDSSAGAPTGRIASGLTVLSFRLDLPFV